MPTWTTTTASDRTGPWVAWLPWSIWLECKRSRSPESLRCVDRLHRLERSATQTVTSVKVEAEQNDHQSDSEKLAIGGLLLGLPRQAEALGGQPLERVVYPYEGGNDQVRKVSPAG